MTEGNIDLVLDELAESGTNGCGNCQMWSEYMVKLECEHLVCLDCMNDLVNSNNYKSCPCCKVALIKDINKLYTSYISNPIINLMLNHEISIGEYVWAYSGGNAHYWLYDAKKIAELEKADSEGKNQVEIEVGGPNKTETYIVDLDLMVQYPKKYPSKKRNVVRFLLKSKKDLVTNKIVGIAGKLI